MLAETQRPTGPHLFAENYFDGDHLIAIRVEGTPEGEKLFINEKWWRKRGGDTFMRVEVFVHEDVNAMWPLLLTQILGAWEMRDFTDGLPQWRKMIAGMQRCDDNLN